LTGSYWVYELKESFPGFGNDDGGSLAGKLSARVLSIIFSFLFFPLLFAALVNSPILWVAYFISDIRHFYLYFP
jgi:hypothetical protein